MGAPAQNARLLGLSALLMPLLAVCPQALKINNIMARQGLTQDLCSNVNTGSGNANTSQWQSNGLCSDYCRDGDYAFAIMQWQSCWCSNVAPDEDITTDVDDCSEGCPGYGDVENCGRRPSYYGYISLQRSPTSTQGASSSSTSTSEAESTTQQAPPPPATKTVHNTVTVTPSSPATSQQSTSESITTSDESTTSTPSSASETTVTADGTVRTVFVTPTPDETSSNDDPDSTSDESNMGSESDDSDSGPSAGAIAGIVVGVVLGFLALAALFFFLWFRKKKKNQAGEEKYDEPAVSSNRGSSAGMIAGAAGAPRNPDMVVTVDGRSWEPDSNSEQRRSRLMAVDPRLDPFGMWNKSRESVNTIRDDADYSRRVAKPVLRPTNPDPANDD